MTQSDVRLSFYLKKSEINEEGRCPIMVQLAVGRNSRSSFSVKLSAPLKLWASGRVKGKSVVALEVNRRLDEIRASAFNIHRELSSVHQRVTADDVKCRLLGMAEGQVTLLSYFESFLDKFDGRIGINRCRASAKSYHYAYKKLSVFLRHQYKLSDISFTALDRSFIEKYDTYLRTDCHLAPGSIILLTTRLNTVIGEAIADGIITANPFCGYKPKRPVYKGKYLTSDELHRLMTTPLHSDAMYLVRDMFLFSCFTGISFDDMHRLSVEHLERSMDGRLRIRSRRKKTGVVYEVPLLELPLHIIDKYRDAAPDGRLLPMYNNSDMNRYLKRVAGLCGIERRIVFHMARHTYATEITLSHGVPLETVSRMLGHTRITTTQIYAKVTDDKIDTDTKLLNDRIAERFPVVI